MNASDCIDLTVVVLDLEMPVFNGLERAKELTKMPSPPAVVICSVATDPEMVEAARKAGATGYVFKMNMARDLVEAVKAAARGERFVSTRESPSNPADDCEPLCVLK